MLWLSDIRPRAITETNGPSLKAIELKPNTSNVPRHDIDSLGASRFEPKDLIHTG